ncbi:riboflavin synthase [Sphingobacterium daejeonense]|uniref:riboflavin synthase n=1 Tax=Sphingobacterium daejeonense TaxID=371142 RepID=UPI0021A6FF21|nr:riboflavin synthase [Sphingobacterium daejeonense]MCT1531466.1 riboflavin synthase [Sphingobacterium daejeonense]
MFTGIIETLGTVKKIEHEQSNIHYFIESSISPTLKIDQSVSHNGVCLTVVGIDGEVHQVTAIHETLEKSNLGKLKEGDIVNLERCVKADGRLDGHIVQGHVDQTAICTAVEPQDGSVVYSFEYDSTLKNLTVEKGSITVNGISLTVVNSGKNNFSVAIIPYTLENTNLKTLEIGSTVNLEFDIIGKYVNKLLSLRD